MSSIKQSFCYPCFMRGEGLTLEKLIKEAADIGYAGVELWARANAPFDEIVGLAKAHGLDIPCMSGHDSLPDGLNKRENHDRIEQELLESIELAAKLGIPGLICFSGNREGLGDEEGIDIVAEGFDRVKGAAEKNGINLNLELLNSKVDHPDYQCDFTDWGVEVCQRVGSPRIKLLYDIYHVQIMEGDLIRTLRENIDHIGHFHTAGNPGRNDLDEDQEIYYPGVMRAITETNYDLYVAHEFTPKGDALAALRTAFEVCDV
jgi:hydroxypyruvate isomerase